MKNPIRRVRPEKTGVKAPLGELETAIMRCLWGGSPEGLSALDVQQELEGDKKVAITTVLTTLDRLHGKGIVRRHQEGRSYRFYAAVTQDQLERQIVENVLDSLIAQFPKAVATYFSQGLPTEAKGKDNAQVLADLAARIEAIGQSTPSEAKKASPGEEEKRDNPPTPPEEGTQH